MRDRIREWLIAVIGLGALIALYEWHGGTSIWFLIILTGIFMLGGLILQCFGAQHIEVKRTVNPIRLIAGKTAEVEVHIQFKSILPLPWMSITDYFTEGSHSKLWFPGWRRSYTYNYCLQNLPRGKITFQVCHVEWGGLFRFFKNSYLLPCEEDILVFPIPAAISITQGWTSQDIREREQVTHQQSAGVWGLDVRDYNMGDPLNRVHWKSSARRGRLQTRLYEAVEDQAVCIILDHCPDNYKIATSGGTADKDVVREGFEGAVSIAAGLFISALDEGVQVELISGDMIERPQPVFPTFDTTLAVIEPNGKKNMSMVMDENTDHLLPGTQVYVITGGLHHELIGAVSKLHHKGLKIDIYSIVSYASASQSKQNVGNTEQATQEEIADSLGRIRVRVHSLEVASLDIRNDIDRVPVKGVNNHDSILTERKNSYL